MVTAAPIKTSWRSGEWSPLLEGNILLERWPDSSRLVQNMICLKQGPITRRGGTKFVKEVKNSADDTALIPFEYNVEQEYNIEAGDGYFRFYTSNEAIVETAQTITSITTASPGVFEIAGHGYTDGEEVYIAGISGQTSLNGKFYLIDNATTDEFELTDTDGNPINVTVASTGGTARRTYEIDSPYASADLFDSNGLPRYQYAQSADVLYVCHGLYPTISLNRTGNTNWTVNTMVFDDGPYLPLNDTATTIALSGTSGSVTVTASAIAGINDGDGFKATDVGRLIRFKDPANNWTWLKITAYTDTTHVTATIMGDSPSAGTATANWRLGLFSETTGYPTVISFFQDRVFLAGASSYPDRWALTRTGGYSDMRFYFAPTDKDGTVTDDAGISGTLQSGKVNSILWASLDDKGLMIGTAAREWILRASATGEALTPGNAKADSFSSVGSSYVQPINVENGTIFVQRARRKIFDVIYSLDRDQLKPRDLTIACEHISRSGIAEIKFQQEPINCIWMRRTDGLLIGYTYYQDEAVFAAHRHPLGGDGIVKSLSVIPSADGSRDEPWMIVERTIDGVTRKYIEYMTPYYEDDTAKEYAFCIDCGLTYDGAPVSSISGLDHLEGKTVKLMVDGKSHPDRVVTGGSISLANGVMGSVVQIGLGYTWAWKSQRTEAGSTNGTAQGKIKRITKFVVRLANTLGLYYGSSADSYEEYDFNQASTYDEDLGLYSGDTEQLAWPGGYESDGTVYLQHDGVFPATIQAVMPIVTTQDG